MEIGDDRVQLVTIIIDPVKERTSGQAIFVVLFIDNGPTLKQEDILGHVHGGRDEALGHLERELRDTRERLQSMIEEYETALEELKSSNEELVSVNEELQSTNEELEASKEELQSLNEELQTINVEFGHKIDALDQSNSDLRNLFESTQIATIFLDQNLVIRTFTQPAERFFNLVPDDRGRKLTTFSCCLAFPDLNEKISETLLTGIESERLAGHLNDRSQHLVRLQPYRGFSGDTEGVIITFVDVTKLKTGTDREPGIASPP